MLATRAVTVRNLPADIHAALRLRAAQHQRSTEAEIRAILAAAVASPTPEGSIEEFFNTLPPHITPENPLSIADINAITVAGWAGQLAEDA